ncbi:MAG: M23 family metallopeptidase [Spirochaetales bacterium]|nr:MAG: M23 family metallopeptidase [Spirochaetales bacterium]
MIRKISLLLLLLTAAARLWTMPKVVVPEAVEPGCPLVVAMKGEQDLEQVGVSLLNAAGGRLLVAGVFHAGDGGSIVMSLMGIPDYFSPGTYEIEMEGRDGTNYFWLRRTVKILPRIFAAEDIEFSTDMTDLKNDNEPKRIEEYYQLLAILHSFHPAALYHPDSFSFPLEQLRQTSGFGDRRGYFYADGGRDSSIHAGIDYGAAAGTPVFASGKGRVVFSSARIITGNTVVIEHMPSLYSLYYHLNSLAVRPDDIVEQGALLGTVGATGLVTGPHLHWEFRLANVPVDPLWFTGNKVLDMIKIMSIMDSTAYERGGD